MSRTALVERVKTSRGEWLHKGTIVAVKRAGMSTMGNPSYDVTFAGSGEGAGYERGQTFRTQTNSSVGYEIDNPEYRGVPVVVALTKAGRIFAIEVAQ